MVSAPLNRRPEPNSLVTTDVRGFRNDAVHMGRRSCASRPISRARAFSRSIRAVVAASSGRVKLLSTASGCATGGGRAGKAKRTRALSVFPEASSTVARAKRVPVASTGTPPIACHAPGAARTKWSGSPANVPRIESIESLLEAGVVSVRRTMAPGSGRAGVPVRRAPCALSALARTHERAIVIASVGFTL